MANGILKFIQRLTEASGLSANETALYSKDDGNIYKKAYGGDEILIPAGGVWQDWTPTFTSPFIGMTFTVTSINYCRYCIIGKICFLDMNITGTTGGSAFSAIQCDIPVPSVTTGLYTPMSGYLIDGEDVMGLPMLHNTNQVLQIFKYNFGNFGLGENRWISVSGQYRIA